MDDRLTNKDDDGQQPDILKVYDIDMQTAQELFLLCNEYASKLTVQANFDSAQVLIE